MSSTQQQQLAAQAARVLEQLQTLVATYCADMSAASPNLTAAVSQCSRELTQFLSTVEPYSPNGRSDRRAGGSFRA